MLLTLSGGQWALLQSAAWAGMLVSHLRTDGVPQAITKTFDGNHQCPLCKAVESGQKSEKKSEAAIKVPQVEFPPTEFYCLLNDAPNCLSTIPWTDEFADSRSCLPRLRPPRLIPA